MNIDYRLAFDLAPVGLALSRQRTMVDCNQALCDMFGASREQLVGQSFQILYPSADEYERTGARIAPILGKSGTYADDRIMKRVEGRLKGEPFWCHVTGRALRRQNAAAPEPGQPFWTLLQQMQVRGDTAWQSYIEGMGKKIAAVSERPGYHYRFYIVESSTVNAFAVPDGSVSI